MSDDLIRRAREALVDVTPGPWAATRAAQAAEDAAALGTPLDLIAIAREALKGDSDV